MSLSEDRGVADVIIKIKISIDFTRSMPKNKKWAIITCDINTLPPLFNNLYCCCCIYYLQLVAPLSLDQLLSSSFGACLVKLNKQLLDSSKNFIGEATPRVLLKI